MIRRGLVCLLFATMAWGQAANSNATSAPASPATPSAQAPGDAQPGAAPASPDQVPMDKVVLTIPGVCDNAAANPAPADCKTTMTRSEFEALVKAVAPNMPPQAHRQLAQRYASALVMAQEAKKEGLDKGPKYEEMQKLSQMQTLAQLLGESLREKAGQISDADIEDYYKKNADNFQEGNFERIFVPITKQPPASKVKLTAAQTKLQEETGQAAMKTEAVSIQKRAAAAGDFEKLQAEAFTTAGMKSKAPTTKMEKIRKSNLPAEQQSVFDLKPGEVSPLISDESGYFIYKAGEKSTPKLEDAKEEIKNKLRAQRLQDSMQAVQKMATPTLDDAYFAAPPANPMQGMQMPGQPAPPSPKAQKPEQK
jgi:peptidyl-prolyl cis-trans isomerase C